MEMYPSFTSNKKLTETRHLPFAANPGHFRQNDMPEFLTDLMNKQRSCL